MGKTSISKSLPTGSAKRRRSKPAAVTGSWIPASFNLETGQWRLGTDPVGDTRLVGGDREPDRPWNKYVPTLSGKVAAAGDRDLFRQAERMADSLVESRAVDRCVEVTRQAELRRRRIERFAAVLGLLTAAQVAEMSGSRSSNKSATTSRWLREEKIFAVLVQGQQRFPAFQFDEAGMPKSVVARVVARLPFERNSWATAFWFDTPHVALPGHAKPVALIDRNPALVLEAAAATADELAAEWV